jgi:hypothetical protein
MKTMTARKAQLAGLAAILTLSTTAGCGALSDVSDDTPSAAPTSTAPLDPQIVLVDAVPGDDDGAYHFDVKGAETPTSGVLDAAHKAVEIKVVQKETDVPFTLTMTTRMIGDRTWVKMAFTPASVPGLPKVPKSWQLLDAAKVKDKSIVGYDGSTDPGYAQLLVQKASGIKQSSPGHFTGTTDLTQSTEAEIVDQKTLKALGAKAKKVPFTAVVDAQGNLTSLIAKIPAAGQAKAKTYAVTYSGFGQTATPAAPAAGEQQKAASVIYEMMEG